MKDKFYEIEKLYQKIHQCHICPEMDKDKVLRRMGSTNIDADVFIVSQALAENTLRKSGINFLKPDGNYGSTGKSLEKFLAGFDRTIDPRSPKCVYNTEIAQCFPGKLANGKGDRTPTNTEVSKCLGYLKSEIEIIKPQLILVMGRKSRDTFWKYILDKTFPKFSEHVGTVEYFNKIPVIPIQHASGANWRFKKMLNDETLTNNIKNIL